MKEGILTSGFDTPRQKLSCLEKHEKTLQGNTDFREGFELLLDV